MLQRVIQFLKDNPVFYVATVDAGKPRVRPFGIAVEHDGKIYFCTSNVKQVYRQLQANPYVEISTTAVDFEWLRLSGKAVFEPNPAVKKKAFEISPILADLYNTPENPEFAVFYLEEAEAVFCKLTGGQESGKL
ncbi:MAG: pyridoxamine 5'-phosphate oxidase family protein [Planctomycetaceae bacterium]|jgi:uncharacterized pyridoxamine 5'-phosphate oxidase family protein|nr:pyridoxamine 5'-phosphate oxidase family protein [Planctomycetaceae bacterium]